MKELISIISELKAPKDKHNSFGKFDYRDAAGILEAAKPLLTKYECLLNFGTRVEVIGDRYYLWVKAVITNKDGKSVEAEAPAREQDHKSGMDDAQLTGACISYAKKYALCNLFCIDDSSNDPDTDDSTAKQRGTNESGNAPRTQNKPSADTKPSTQATAPTTKKDAPKSNEIDYDVVKAELLKFVTAAEAKKYLQVNHIDLTVPELADVRDQLNKKFFSK